MTTDDFIKISQTQHNSYYNYNDSIYVRSDKKILINCPNHGDFWQVAHSHMTGTRCPNCHKESITKGKDKFVEDANNVHEGKYDYSRVIYKNGGTKVEIICKDHGSFYQTPGNHLTGYGCPACGLISRAKTRQLPWEEFLQRTEKSFKDKLKFVRESYSGTNAYVTAKCSKHGEFSKHASSFIRDIGCTTCVLEEKHNKFISDCIERFGNKFDLSQVVYKHSKEEVIIVCPRHGKILIQPTIFLQSVGCQDCDKQNRKEHFINRSTKKFGKIYDYSRVEYVNAGTHVTIICNKHGEFRQSPESHLVGKGCPDCALIGRTQDQDAILTKAKKRHDGYYTYENSVYVNRKTKMTITCPEHGDFQQTPEIHLKGGGCTICNRSLGEKMIMEILDKHGITYVSEYCIPNNRYRYDFYLPDFNILIEYHGIQHFQFVEFFHRDLTQFNFRKTVDQVKEKLARSWKIPLLILTFRILELGKICMEENLLHFIQTQRNKRE